MLSLPGEDSFYLTDATFGSPAGRRFVPLLILHYSVFTK